MVAALSPVSNCRASRATVITLWVVFVMFCLRVLGQVAVVLWQPSWLPPMEKWYSGLLPYPYLLPSQFLVIAILFGIAWGVTRHRGFVVVPRPRFTRGIFVFAGLYLGGMLVRYVTRMSTMPEERWAGGCIPIFMHWGLALFLFVYASFRRSLEAAGDGVEEEESAP